MKTTRELLDECSAIKQELNILVTELNALDHRHRKEDTMVFVGLAVFATIALTLPLWLA